MIKIKRLARKATKLYLVAISPFFLFSAELLFGEAMAGDTESGRALVAQWCINCHDIENDSIQNDGAPSFETIMNKHDRSSDWLTAWLMTPHVNMPDLSLSRIEIDDLVTYLESIRGP